MDVETQEKVVKKTSKNIIVISLMVFILLMLAIAGQITYTVLKSETAYNGVYVNQHNVSGMNRQEIKNLLNDNYQSKVKELKFSIKAKKASENISFADIQVKYDIEKAAEMAFEVGRKGNILDRIIEIVETSANTEKIALPYSFDKASAMKAIDKLYGNTYVEVADADLKIGNDSVVLVAGHQGQSIDKDKLLAQIDSLVGGCKAEDIEVPIVYTAPKKMDVEDLYKKISQEPVDAKPEIKENSVSITPHVVGRNIDKSSLANIVLELEKSEDTRKTLPVEFIQPKITTQIAQENLFKDTLGTMSTRFSTGNQNDANRGVNIRIAVSRINGTVLAPGQVFSFNKIVGERSEAGGYKTAHTYVGGKIVDGIGGGICQVSTTLYNAVLFADVSVEERTNHMFTVGYVPYGRDAAVAYPYVDFKFKNSTNWPIKVEGYVTNSNQIVFTLKGTDETPGKTVIITPQTIKTIEPPPVKYIDDPTLPVGTEKVDHEAMKGYVIDTFKIVKQGGKVIKEEKLHRSTYKALEKTIKKGTKKDPNAPVKPLVETQKPGVDEAANPPAKPVE